MSDYRMEVIKQTEKHEIPILRSDEKGKAVLVGGGKDNCLCGNCNRTICQDVKRAWLQNWAFECAYCGSLNRLGEM